MGWPRLLKLLRLLKWLRLLKVLLLLRLLKLLLWLKLLKLLLLLKYAPGLVTSCAIQACKTAKLAEVPESRPLIVYLLCM